MECLDEPLICPDIMEGTFLSFKLEIINKCSLVLPQPQLIITTTSICCPEGSKYATHYEILKSFLNGSQLDFFVISTHTLFHSHTCLKFLIKRD